MVTTTLADRLRFLLYDRRKQKVALAAAAEVSRQAVYDWLKGGDMEPGRYPLVAAFFDVTPAQLRGEDPIPGLDTPPVRRLMPLEQTPDLPEGFVARRLALQENEGLFREVATEGRRLNLSLDTPEAAPPREGVPVIADVQAGPDGFFGDRGLPAGAGDGRILFATKDENAYALRVRGDSMRPRIRSGEFVIVEPNRTVRPGDDVVIVMHDGRRAVKQYLYDRGDDMMFRSINETFGDMTVPKAEIRAVHFVGGIVPRASMAVIGEAD